MKNLPSAVQTRIAQWPPAAQQAFETLRGICHNTATHHQLGPLEESLKWGQPAWRPVKPNTGSTLRVMWEETTPDLLNLYVGCKTDLAARMREIYPDLPQNDDRRHIALRLSDPLPVEALSHLASMTLAYHQSKAA